MVTKCPDLESSNWHSVTWDMDSVNSGVHGKTPGAGSVQIRRSHARKRFRGLVCASSKRFAVLSETPSPIRDPIFADRGLHHSDSAIGIFGLETSAPDWDLAVRIAQVARFQNVLWCCLPIVSHYDCGKSYLFPISPSIGFTRSVTCTQGIRTFTMLHAVKLIDL